MAGLNAACRAAGAGPDRVLTRSEAYIGVLVDDLVLQGVTEPYRMLTARSEHRLALRADNAGLRLTGKGIAWGCVGPERAAMQAGFSAAVAEALARARQEGGRRPSMAAGIAVNQDGRWRTALEALALPAMAPEAAERLFPWLRDLAPRVRAELEARALYAPYLERQAAELRVLEREEKLAIPPILDFAEVPGFRRRCGSGWPASRPATLGGAGRVPGSPRRPWRRSRSIFAGPRRVSRETPGRGLGVSRETEERLRAYLALLIRWNARINLVADASPEELWQRHVLDCLQCSPCCRRPRAPGRSGLRRRLSRAGPGAGTGRETHLVESDRANPLSCRRPRASGLSKVIVHPTRIEAATLPPAAILTARALAPLPQLLRYAHRILAPTASRSSRRAAPRPRN